MKKLLLALAMLFALTFTVNAQNLGNKILTEIGTYTFGKIDTAVTYHTVATKAFGIDIKDSMCYALEYTISDTINTNQWIVDSLMVDIVDTIKFTVLPFNIYPKAKTYTTFVPTTAVGWLTTNPTPEGLHISKAFNLNYGYLRGACQITIAPKTKFPDKWINRTLRVTIYKISR